MTLNGLSLVPLYTITSYLTSDCDPRCVRMTLRADYLLHAQRIITRLHDMGHEYVSMSVQQVAR